MLRNIKLMSYCVFMFVSPRLSFDDKTELGLISDLRKRVSKVV